MSDPRPVSMRKETSIDSALIIAMESIVEGPYAAIYYDQSMPDDMQVTSNMTQEQFDEMILGMADSIRKMRQSGNN